MCTFPGDFVLMGSKFQILGDSTHSAQSSISYALHIAEQVRQEYPCSDITHVLALTCVRLGELLYSTQTKTENSKTEQYEVFVARLVDILAQKPL